VNKNVNEEDLKCQQKAEHEYDNLFSDTIKVSHAHGLNFTPRLINVYQET
jgi:hypothetical protein